jgi:hypothetical protein
MQKPDFVFRRNGRVHLNRRRRQFSRLLAAEACGSVFIVGSNAGYTMFRGSKKGTGYPLHSPVSPSLPLPASPCAITFQLESTYLQPTRTPTLRNNTVEKKLRIFCDTSSKKKSAICIQKDSFHSYTQHKHKSIWKNGGIAPFILNPDT